MAIGIAFNKGQMHRQGQMHQPAFFSGTLDLISSQQTHGFFHRISVCYLGANAAVCNIFCSCHCVTMAVPHGLKQFSSTGHAIPPDKNSMSDFGTLERRCASMHDCLPNCADRDTLCKKVATLRSRGSPTSTLGLPLCLLQQQVMTAPALGNGLSLFLSLSVFTQEGCP